MDLAEQNIKNDYLVNEKLEMIEEESGGGVQDNTVMINK